MYRNLLVPLDGSSFAEHALPLALNIAQRAGASVRVALVHTPAAGVYGGAELAVDPSLDAQIRDSHKAYLLDALKRLTSAAPMRVTSTLLDGPIADAIHEYAVASQIDLIVMATHGRGPFSRFWLGSVADRLMRRASVPVLLVRPSAQAPDFAAKPVLRRLLIPLDGSVLAEQILEPATELGSLMKAEYTLLRVIEPIVLPEFTYRGAVTPAWDAATLRKLQTEAQTYLDGVANRLRARSLTVRTQVITNQPASIAILEAGKADDIDLIALASHGRGGLARLMLGSVADKVVRGAPTAVLIHHPPAK